MSALLSNKSLERPFGGRPIVEDPQAGQQPALRGLRQPKLDLLKRLTYIE